MSLMNLTSMMSLTKLTSLVNLTSLANIMSLTHAETDAVADAVSTIADIADANSWMLLLPILIPAIGAIIVFLLPKLQFMMQQVVAMLASAGTLAVTIMLYGKELRYYKSWAGFGMNFDLRLYSFSAMILLVAVFAFLTILYASIYMKDKPGAKQFFAFVLLATSFVSGAMLANNLVLMLFFWEGLLGILFALIYTGGRESSATAIKALVLNGFADLCLILGVCLTGWLAQTLTISDISVQVRSFWSSFAFVMMMIGAIGKAGSMPLHTWIPDAAVDTNAPFMAFLPAALDKLLGIYLLARLTLDLFQIEHGSRMSNLMVLIGCCTIIFAVLMALIQKDYRKLLGYHAVSQVGYMILGIGTALPVGIVGGIFHMVNNALYKSCLFFTAGSVEMQAGTTDLKVLGGLGKKMPVTCAGFMIAALSIAGVPPFNGFFSKELVFDAALETNIVVFIVAAAGAFCTAASFLKLGHTVYFGELPRPLRNTKEAGWPILVPIVVLAAACVLFGVYNPLPLKYMIEPILGERIEHTFSGLPHSWVLPAISGVILILAIVHHRYGVKKSGKPVGAVDHIHHARGLSTMYDYAEAGSFDPYKGLSTFVEESSILLFGIDRLIDWVYTGLATGFASLLAAGVARVHTGKHWMYVLWTIAGGLVVIAIEFGIGG